MKIFWKQFWKNMFIGIFYSLIWYYVFYNIFNCFWIPTILTNIIGFFIGRYYIFKEGKSKQIKEEVKDKSNGNY